jgi:F0F1-type ATP synthase delta subunit
MLIQLLIIQIVTFLLLIVVLRFLSTRHLNGALNRLNALHEENLVKEAQLTEELKIAHEERIAEVNKGKEEAAFLVEEAKKDGLKIRLKVEEEAKLQAQMIIAEGREELGKFQDKLRQEMENKSVDLAVSLVAQIFAEKNRGYLQHEFANEIINEVSKLEKSRFTVITDRVKVVTSSPLEEAQRDNLKNVLLEKLGVYPVLIEEVDEGLISGLTLEIGGLVIDGSLKNKLSKFMSEFRKN